MMLEKEIIIFGFLSKNFGNIYDVSGVEIKSLSQFLLLKQKKAFKDSLEVTFNIQTLALWNYRVLYIIKMKMFHLNNI